MAHPSHRRMCSNRVFLRNSRRHGMSQQAYTSWKYQVYKGGSCLSTVLFLLHLKVSLQLKASVDCAITTDILPGDRGCQGPGGWPPRPPSPGCSPCLRQPSRECCRRRSSRTLSRPRPLSSFFFSPKIEYIGSFHFSLLLTDFYSLMISLSCSHKARCLGPPRLWGVVALSLFYRSASALKAVWCCCDSELNCRDTEHWASLSSLWWSLAQWPGSQLTIK